MVSARFVFLAALLLGSAALAHADGVPVDPLIDVSDPFCPPESTCPNPINPGQGFQFTSDAAGGGVFMATNRTGVTWGTLVFLFANSVLGPFTCTSGGPNIPYQQGCAPPTSNGEQRLTFVSACPVGSDVCTPRPGILNDFVFTVTLGLWPPGTLIQALPNGTPVCSTCFVTLTSVPVPEPATLTLFGLGLGALVVKRRFRSQRQPRN
jgi:hypothetical protein